MEQQKSFLALKVLRLLLAFVAHMNYNLVVALAIKHLLSICYRVFRTQLFHRLAYGAQSARMLLSRRLINSLFLVFGQRVLRLASARLKHSCRVTNVFWRLKQFLVAAITAQRIFFGCISRLNGSFASRQQI